ncbi:sec14p-like phosphatidylinositol transfer family protein [Tanacetum coccineum]|uniref:Sec14p-like phosphatidylinositol transfer family protein n=1 Tax=Tanacetum coccineum TaxID=301880 RepID=A0ABQ4ZQN9_9ASTR
MNSFNRNDSGSQNLHQGYPTEMVIRFLKARDGNISKAYSMLVDCLNWRIENDIDKILSLLTVISSIDDLNYPEKTDTYYIVNAPYVFSACWKPSSARKNKKELQVLPIMDYEALPHFCRRQGSGSSKYARNSTGEDCCFSLDHGFHQQLYNYINDEALGIKPRVPIKQGSFHVGFPEPNLTERKNVQTIETEFHKLEIQNGFTDKKTDVKTNGNEHQKETTA